MIPVNTRLAGRSATTLDFWLPTRITRSRLAGLPFETYELVNMLRQHLVVIVFDQKDLSSHPNKRNMRLNVVV